MPPAADVDARILELARLSAAEQARPEVRREMAARAREARRTALVDMGSSTVDARIRELAQLSALCRSLGATSRSRGA